LPLFSLIEGAQINLVSGAFAGKTAFALDFALSNHILKSPLRLLGSSAGGIGPAPSIRLAEGPHNSRAKARHFIGT